MSLSVCIPEAFVLQCNVELDVWWKVVQTLPPQDG